MGRRLLFRSRLIVASFTTLIGLAALLLATVALAPHLISQDYYRRLITGHLGDATGARIQISGSVRAHIIPYPSLSIEGLKLHSRDDTYHARIARLSTTLAWKPLFRGRLAVDDLQIQGADVALDLATKETAPFVLPDLSGLDRFQAHIQDLTLRVTNREGAQPLTVHLDELEIAKDDVTDQLWLQSKGSAANHPFSARAVLEHVSQLPEPPKPLPLEVVLSGNAGHLNAKGTVANPIRGEGLDLVITGEAPETTRLLNLVGVHAPDIGRLHLSARLSGEAMAPRLSRLELTAHKPPDISLRANGAIGDLWTQRPTQLRFSGQIDDKDVLAALIPEGVPPLENLDLRGSLLRHGPGDPWRIEGLQAHADTTQGLKLVLKGATGLSARNPGQPFVDMDLKLSLSSPTTAAARAFLFDKIPELGPVQGQVRLRTPGEALAIEDIDIHIGEVEKIAVSVQGRIGRVPLDPDTPNSGIDLDLQLRAQDTKALAEALAQPLPELGPMEASGHFSGSVRKSRLTGLRLHAGNARSLELRAQGSVRMGDLNGDKPIQKLEITAQGRASTTDELSRVFDVELPELGPVTLDTRLRGSGADLEAPEVKVDWGHASRLRFRAEGTVRRIGPGEPLLRGIRLRVRAKAPATAPLGGLFNRRQIPELGPVDARFSLSGTNARLQIRRLELDIGRPRAVQLEARGGIDQIDTHPALRWRGLDLQITGSSPNTGAIARILGYKVPELGPVRGSGRLVGSERSVVLNDIKLSAGPPSTPVLSATGEIGNLPRLDSLSIRTRLDAPYTLFAPKGALTAVGEDARIVGNLTLRRVKGVFGAERFSIRSQAAQAHSFYIRGVLRDISGLNGLDAKIDFRALDTSTLGLLMGKHWPPLPSTSGTGTLKGNLGTVRFDGRVRVGRTKARIQTRFTLGQARPRIQGTIRIPQLYLTDFRAADTDSEETEDASPPSGPRHRTRPKTTQLFSRTPLPFDRLRLFDLALDLDVDEVMGTKNRLANIQASVDLKDGRLWVRPAQMTYQTGSTQLELHIDSQAKPPTQNLELAITGLSLGELLGELEHRPPATGTLHLSASLSGSGQSAHEIASGLKGDLKVALVEGEIRQTDLSLFVGNYLGWAINAGIKPNKYSRLDCGTLSLEARDGQGDSTLLFLDGEDLSMRGKLSVDLGRETIDAVLLPKPKRRFWAVANPVRLTGPIMDPRIDVLSARNAVNAIGGSAVAVGGLIAAPYVFLSSRVFGTLFPGKSEQTTPKKALRKCLKRASGDRIGDS